MLMLRVSACATPAPPAPSVPKVNYDEYTKRKSVSYLVEDVAVITGEAPGFYSIRGDENAVAIYTFFIVSEWVFFDQAYANGRTYHVVDIDRQVPGSYGVQETMQVVMPRDEWDDLARDGIRLSIRGQRGSSEFEVPAAKFKEFFDVYDNVQW